MKTRILTAAEVAKVLAMELAVDAVERAFDAHGRGAALMPPKVYLPLEEHAGDFRAMPAYLDGSAGVKWVNSHPENPRRHGLPAVIGIYVLSDPATAAPLAVMDGTLLTAFRTGAAGAVASKHLGRKDVRTIGIVGCGVQSRTVLAAHRVLFPSLELLAADVDPDAASAFASEAGGRAVSVAEAAGADLVCTLTPSRRPIVRRDWVRPGTHLNAMGADGPGKQELDPQILLDARVVIDAPEQSLESGELNVPLHAGTFDRGRIHATLGEIVAGLKPGRADDREITVFDSTGLAVQDVALARVVYDEAVKAGLGIEVEFDRQ